MDTLKYKVFVRAVELGSMYAVAMEMGYSPSGILRIINSMESEIGFCLSYRSSQGISLTKEGELLYPLIRDVVYSSKSAEQKISEIKGSFVGSMTIGSLYSVAASWLPKVIKALDTDYPNVQIHIVHGDGDDLLNMMEEHSIDCCICASIPKNNWTLLGTDCFMAWVPENSPYANYSVFPMEKINNAPFVYPLPGRYPGLEALFKKYNVKPNIRYTAADNLTTYAMVEAGLGISLNNRLADRDFKGHVKIIPLDPPEPIPIVLATPDKKYISPVTKRFVAYAEKHKDSLFRTNN